MTNVRNNVQLIGHLGVDPEVKHLENGKVVANLRMATSDYYTNKEGERVQTTQWHNLVIWGNPASVAEKYLRKGSEIAVNGKLTYRKYDSKEGDTKYFTEVLVSEFTMLGGKSKDGVN